jgi:hypothetical protein
VRGLREGEMINARADDDGQAYISLAKLGEPLYVRADADLDDGTEVIAGIEAFDKDGSVILTEEYQTTVQNKKIEQAFDLWDIFIRRDKDALCVENMKGYVRWDR